MNHPCASSLTVGNWRLYHSDTTEVLRRLPKIEGGHFGLRATSAWFCEARSTPSTHLRSPSLTLAPALRVGAGKSGVGRGEWKVSSPQFSDLLSRQVKRCAGFVGTRFRKQGV